MKRILLVGMLVISGLSFGRDFTYNETRDIVQPAQEQQERVSRYNSSEWATANEQTKENLETYSQFHSELANMDRGHDNR